MKFIFLFINTFYLFKGQGLIYAPVYSFLPILYRDTLEDKIANIEAVSGFGFSVSPFVSGVLFGLGGWELPFIFDIIFTLLIIPVCLKHLPMIIKRPSQEELEEPAKEQKTDKPSDKPRRLSQQESVRSAVKEDESSLSSQIVNRNFLEDKANLNLNNVNSGTDAGKSPSQEPSSNQIQNTNTHFGVNIEKFSNQSNNDPCIKSNDSLSSQNDLNQVQEKDFEVTG